MEETQGNAPQAGGADATGAGGAVAAEKKVDAGLDAMNVDKLNLLKDVEIPVSVEIGQTSLAVREILDLDRGSILTLDKEAEEPMDIRVNGKLIARGEIVVVKENFGIRITEIIDEEGGFA